MEECEALCTRLVIMVNGEFKCLGSPQHLKAKFGNGYKLSIRLNNETSMGTKRKLFDFMKENFAASINTETHKNLFEFTIPFNVTKLSKIFGMIETSRDELDIKDYSVTQTTLDQIFVNFAKSQKEEAFMDDNDDDVEIVQEEAPNDERSNTQEMLSVEQNLKTQMMPLNDDNLVKNVNEEENRNKEEEEDHTVVEKMSIDESVQHLDETNSNRESISKFDQKSIFGNVNSFFAL